MNKTKIIILNLGIILSLCNYLPAKAMMAPFQGASQAPANFGLEHRIAIPKSSCFSLLALCGGIAGLTIITKTFQQLLKQNRQVQRNKSTFNTKSLGLYGLGFGTGVAFLASSIVLLKNNLGI